ncbi:MAG: ribosome maturation factor, partial [Saprospiraceae bacterium]|nr:ribosome maturation factor [Saprospiraceae bacterium]
MNINLDDKIESWLESKFKESDFENCFLVEQQFNPANNKLEVFVDSDNQLDLRVCTRLSRYLEEKIEEEGLLGEKYTLEVSSPGIGRPLKFKRQYIKN